MWCVASSSRLCAFRCGIGGCRWRATPSRRSRTCSSPGGTTSGQRHCGGTQVLCECVRAHSRVVPVHVAGGSRSCACVEYAVTALLDLLGGGAAKTLKQAAAKALDQGAPHSHPLFASNTGTHVHSLGHAHCVCFVPTFMSFLPLSLVCVQRLPPSRCGTRCLPCAHSRRTATRTCRRAASALWPQASPSCARKQPPPPPLGQGAGAGAGTTPSL
jgi:hypothetical protein